VFPQIHAKLARDRGALWAIHVEVANAKCDRAPLLSGRQLREANSCGGLNLVVWEGTVRAEFEKHGEIYHKVMGAFLEEHRGYLWKEAIPAQLKSVEEFQWALHCGALLWNPAAGRYMESPGKDPREIIREPYILGVARDMGFGKPTSWAGADLL
jgi:hypothetical protein